MKVSVVIPALNEESNIARAIASGWAAGADEVVVADGGSVDQTIANCDGATSVTQCAAGRALQMNAGVEVADGDVIVFLHADNWFAENSLSQMRECLSDGRVVGGSFRQRIEADGARYRLLEWGNAFRAKWLRLPYGDQAIFVRRKDFDELGGFPEIPLMEDVTLMRALRKRGRLALLDGPVHISARRWQKHGVVRQTMRNWWILTKHRLGADPHDLVQYYRRHDRK